MKAKFPNYIELVDCAWLTRVLKQYGAIESGEVASFTVETLSGGYTSSVYRLQLKYDECVCQ